MLNILAETFRVATRSDLGHPPANEVRERRRKANLIADNWFWTGRRWQPSFQD